MPGLTLSVEVGADGLWPIQLNGLDGNPAKGLLSSDALTATVWAGQDQLPLFAASAAWISAPAGTVTLGVTKAQTATLDPGVYRVQVWIARGAQSECGYDGWLEIARAAGLAVAPAVYGSAEDVREHLPFGDRYEPDSGLAAFLRERGRARQWLDGLILQHCPAGVYAGLTPHGAAVANWGGITLGRPRTLKAYLDDNKLILTPEVLGTVARYAAHRVLAYVVGQKPDDTLKRRSAELLVESHQWASRLVCEVDLNGDGFGEWNVALGVTNNRYA